MGPLRLFLTQRGLTLEIDELVLGLTTDTIYYLVVISPRALLRYPEVGLLATSKPDNETAHGYFNREPWIEFDEGLLSNL